MTRDEAKVEAYRTLLARGSDDPVMAAHYIEARLTRIPEKMVHVAKTMNVDDLDRMTKQETAVRLVRGEYDGRVEREEVAARIGGIASPQRTDGLEEGTR